MVHVWTACAKGSGRRRGLTEGTVCYCWETTTGLYEECTVAMTTKTQEAPHRHTDVFRRFSGLRTLRECTVCDKISIFLGKIKMKILKHYFLSNHCVPGLSHLQHKRSLQTCKAQGRSGVVGRGLQFLFIHLISVLVPPTTWLHTDASSSSFSPPPACGLVNMHLGKSDVLRKVTCVFFLSMFPPFLLHLVP